MRRADPARPIRVLYFACTHGDWGGASRVLFTTLSLVDRTRIEPVVALSMHGPAEELLAELGIPCVVWGSLAEYRSPWQYVRAIVRTAAWLRRQGIDLVHMNRANHWRPAEIVAAWLLRVPVVTHFHTVNLDRAPATRLSTAIVAVSQYVADHADSLGVPVHVIHNAVNPVRFAYGRNVRDQLGVADDEVLVTFAGQVRHIKGVDLFIDAARRIRLQNLRFLIVGACRQGPGMDDAYSEAELLARIAPDKRISYAGYRDDMADVYKSSDVIVVPSRWEEPFGLILIEAGIARRPVVATRVGGIPEVVCDGESGFLVASEDTEMMAERIGLLAESAELRQRMGSSGHARVMQRFTLQPVRSLESIYRDILHGERPDHDGDGQN